MVLLPMDMQDLENYQYLMEDMIVLPDITVLCLMVITNGHAFGSSVFHVLRLCTGIRRLILDLPTSSGSEVKLFFVYLLPPDTKGSIFVPKRHI
jgi:hypothetical protein